MYVIIDKLCRKQENKSYIELMKNKRKYIFFNFDKEFEHFVGHLFQNKITPPMVEQPTMEGMSI